MLMSKSPGGMLPGVRRSFMGGYLHFFLSFFYKRTVHMGKRGRGNQERIKAFVGIRKRIWSIISFSHKYMYTHALHIRGESDLEPVFLGG